MLHRYAAAQRLNAFDITLGDGFRMIEEPVQPVERDIAIHLLEDVEHPADGLIIGRVQAERPAVFNQMAHHPLQLIFHPFRQIRTRLEEVFEIRRREHQHLPGAVGAVKSVPCPGEHIGPALKIFQLLLRTLGEQVIGDTYGHLLFGVQLFNNFIIFRVVLETTPASMALVSPRRFSSRINCRVELT